MVRRFLKDRRGNVAIIFGLSVLPLLGFAGAVIDYGRAVSARGSMQSVVDSLALSIAASENRSTEQKIVSGFEAELKSGNSGKMSKDVTFKGFSGRRWINDAEYELIANINVKKSLLQAIPGMGEDLNMSIKAVAGYDWKYSFSKPESTDLSYEAADFNQISVYCFNKKFRDLFASHKPYESMTNAEKAAFAAKFTSEEQKKLLSGEYDRKGRGRFKKIADNFGGKYPNEFPECDDGEVLSYKMRNVREGRVYPSRINNPTPAQLYEYYTDTTIENDVATQNLVEQSSGNHNLKNPNMLETILCDTKEQCQPKNKGGILPNNEERGRGKTRRVETRACETGKYMYFGWEDRPTGDEDFDDIRFVVKCPGKVKDGRTVWLKS